MFTGFLGTLTYAANQRTIATQSAVNGPVEMVAGPPTGNLISGNVYKVTVLDSSQHVRVTAGLADDPTPNVYLGKLTGYSNGGVFTVQVETELNKATGRFDPNQFEWIFSPSPIFAGFTLYNDARAGTFVAPSCFAAGTRILTRRGPVPVEALTLDDNVITAAGPARPVRWLGHRRIAVDRHPMPDAVRPVRVHAHAFGDGRPARDLILSPDHAVFARGVLIPVKHLVDGRAIAPAPMPSVIYHHVELDQHDILFAEGLPCESFLDTGDRSGFDGGAVVTLHPTFGRPTDPALAWESGGCAPLVVAGPIIARVRADLAEHAARRHIRAG